MNTNKNSKHIKNNLKTPQSNTNMNKNQSTSPYQLSDPNQRGHNMIIDEEQAIHQKYLKELTPFNLPRQLAELVETSKEKYADAVKLNKIAKKTAQKQQIRINVSLPNMQHIKSGHPLPLPSHVPRNVTIKILKDYKTALQTHAPLPVFSKGMRKPKAKKITSTIITTKRNLNNLINQASMCPAMIKKITPNIMTANANGHFKKLVNNVATMQDPSISKNVVENNNRSPSLSKRVAQLLLKQPLAIANRHYFNQHKIYQRKVKYIKQQIVQIVKAPLKKKVKPQFAFKAKTQPLKPWIAQGRQQYRKLKKSLLSFQRQLKSKNRGLGVLSRKNKKLIKQFRKKLKFSKYRRYGAQSKFTRLLAQANARYLTKQRAKLAKNVKRQTLYLQHQRLSMINNNNISGLTHKYMHMLIIIWYILINTFIPLYNRLLQGEIWLNYFIINEWIGGAQPQMNNLYLNYAINTGAQAHITPADIYMPSRNPLNNELQMFRDYQRLTANVSYKFKSKNQAKKHFLKSKKSNKLRGFFRISPKLKPGQYQLTRNKFNKSINKKNKGNKNARLTDKEWLLVKKFTRYAYQQQFPVIFSQWKNVKKIQRYIDKQSYQWHQPYVVTNPYYYTTRYKTFIYQTTNI